MLFDSILQTVGRTPVVRVKKLAPRNVNVYAKLESFNPMGSVKDRLALGIIEDAERSGKLKPGQTVIEATSGNTGIGLAMVCAEKGYPLVVTMAESFSVERRKLMRFLGARVVLTPASAKGTGMLAKAMELAEKHGWFLCRQFENEANADMHSRTTAVEILDAFAGRQLDYFVTGCGTGGTLKGIARVLRQRSPATKIMVCEPDNAPVFASGIAQSRKADGSVAGSHPMFRAHVMQGWTPDFISKLAEDAFVDGMVDQILPINGNDAMRASRELAQQEGMFTGITGGATLVGALRIAADAPEGTNILCVLPDTGERYLSTPLFADISADMDEAEWDIARSTAGYRFDSAAAPAVTPAAMPVPVDNAKKMFHEMIGDVKQPVVMFAFEWCEFCWAVRKLFARLNIPYRTIAIDSAEYQRDNLGGEIRTALTASTSVSTIPQVFVGGKFVGGCTETFDAYKRGDLQMLLQQHGVTFDTGAKVDPYAFLPAWLQSRRA
ncbi:MAG TPA: pyridoxal-phosphate dependent enzyme [Steroidobacteraceae bacterium]|nr:pyridoxal-phosphate dependent enzyme [Steroidobacteraceae bacterium]